MNIDNEEIAKKITKKNKSILYKMDQLLLEKIQPENLGHEYWLCIYSLLRYMDEKNNFITLENAKIIEAKKVFPEYENNSNIFLYEKDTLIFKNYGRFAMQKTKELFKIPQISNDLCEDILKIVCSSLSNKEAKKLVEKYEFHSDFLLTLIVLSFSTTQENLLIEYIKKYNEFDINKSIEFINKVKEDIHKDLDTSDFPYITLVLSLKNLLNDLSENGFMAKKINSTLLNIKLSANLQKDKIKLTRLKV